jgi:hypothetical protein
MLLYAVVISTWVREGRLHIESVRTPARSDRPLRDAFSPAPLGHNQTAFIDT